MYSSVKPLPYLLGLPLTIGTNVTIGHLAMLHGCEVGDNTLIGIGAVILNNAKIGKNCIIGKEGGVGIVCIYNCSIRMLYDVFFKSMHWIGVCQRIWCTS